MSSPGDPVLTTDIPAGDHITLGRVATYKPAELKSFFGTFSCRMSVNSINPNEFTITDILAGSERDFPGLEISQNSGLTFSVNNLLQYAKKCTIYLSDSLWCTVQVGENAWLNTTGGQRIVEFTGVPFETLQSRYANNMSTDEWISKIGSFSGQGKVVFSKEW